MRFVIRILVGVSLVLVWSGGYDCLKEVWAQKWEGKKFGYSGDPSKKRGLELGFDRGWKAAKNDEEQAEKLDPRAHDARKLAEELYRYEYGSRKTFFYGFERGFLRGYQQALGGKIPAPPSTIAQTGSDADAKPSLDKSGEKSPPSLQKLPKDMIRSDAL